MKITIVSQPVDNAMPPTPNSIGLWSYEVARRLAREHDVTIYQQQRPGYSADTTIDGIHFRMISARHDQRLKRLTGSVKTALSLSKQQDFAAWSFAPAYALLAAVDARRRGADIVHIMNLSQFAPVFRRALPTAKIVIHMACEWLTQIDAATVSRRLRSIDLVAGCSDYITELVRARHRDYAGTFQTLYNGVDPDDFAAEQKSADDKGPVLLFVGRVSPEKGVHVLIEAMPAVLAKHPRTRLQIVGGHGQLRRDYLVALSTDPSVRALERYYDGDRRDAYIGALKTRIKELNLGAHVCLVGAVDYPEIPARYAGADVLVNPALSESFGRSLIEAMAAGVPVVATDAGGAREVAGDGRCGIVVPRGDTDALAAGILRVLGDPATRTKLIRVGRNRVSESFTWDRVADSAAACYRRLLATKRAA